VTEQARHGGALEEIGRWGQQSRAEADCDHGRQTDQQVSRQPVTWSPPGQALGAQERVAGRHLGSSAPGSTQTVTRSSRFRPRLRSPLDHELGGTHREGEIEVVVTTTTRLGCWATIARAALTRERLRAPRAGAAELMGTSRVAQTISCTR